MNNPYDASNGGTRAMIHKVIISRPSKQGPYKVTRPIVIETQNK